MALALAQDFSSLRQAKRSQSHGFWAKPSQRNTMNGGSN
jgi:hypothetical protein